MPLGMLRNWSCHSLLAVTHAPYITDTVGKLRQVAVQRCHMLYCNARDVSVDNTLIAAMQDHIGCKL